MKGIRETIGRLATVLCSLDPRVSVFLVLVIGLQTWTLPPRGLALLGLGVVLVLTVLGAQDATKLRVARTYLALIAFWVVAQVILLVIQGASLAQGAVAGSILGGRLAILVSLGLILAMLASPRALGLALSWYSRPLLRKSAWKVALALALMVHFLPMVWTSIETTRSSISLRCPDLPWRKRATLIPQATIRALSQKTWEQTIAIAARRLDSADAWKATAKLNWWDLTVLCGLPLLVWSFSLL